MLIHISLLLGSLLLQRIGSELYEIMSYTKLESSARESW